MQKAISLVSHSSCSVRQPAKTYSQSHKELSSVTRKKKESCNRWRGPSRALISTSQCQSEITRHWDSLDPQRDHGNVLQQHTCQQLNSRGLTHQIMFTALCVHFTPLFSSAWNFFHYRTVKVKHPIKVTKKKTTNTFSVGDTLKSGQWKWNI